MKTKGRVRHRRKKGRGGNLKQTKWRFIGMCRNVFKDPVQLASEEFVKGAVSTFSEAIKDPDSIPVVELNVKVYESEFCNRR